MSYIVAIPSYAREELIQKKTLPLLLESGVRPALIHIFVADKQEEKRYKDAIPTDAYGKIIVGKKGIAHQRNFIVDYYPEGKHIVFMDDDITRVERKRGGKISEIQNLHRFFMESFRKLHKHGLYLWTTKNVYNPFYKKQMKEEGHIGLLQFSGDLMGIINRHAMKVKITAKRGEAEQLEMLFRYYEKDGGVLRFENVVVVSPKLTDGGKVKERGSVEARKKDIVPNLKALAKEWSHLVKKTNVADRFRGRPTLELVKTPVKVVEGGAKKQAFDGVDDTTRKQIPLRNRKRTEALADELLKVLRETTIPPIGKARPKGSKRETSRADVIGSVGRTITFGFGDTRHGIKEFATNAEHPRLLRLLAKFGNSVVPKGWKYNAITLNEGVKAKKHKDTKNNGLSVIIGIGDYTGGEVKVWDKDDKNPIAFDVKNKPTMFNGGLLYHQTMPFKGERYTMIFYRQMWEGQSKGAPMIGRGVGGAIFA